MKARLWLSVCALAAIVLAPSQARAECDGACGAGCGGSCSYVVIPGEPYCNPDGSMVVPIKDGQSCWTSACCQFHDACLGAAGCYACNAEALACNAAAAVFYGSPGDGCEACAGPGFPYCDPHGWWGWFDERNYSRTLAPGEAGNWCPRPPTCNPGDGCPPFTNTCVGATDCRGNVCPCVPEGPTPCTGACYPLCGQDDGCGNRCSNADDVCNGCGYTNACGRNCGDCPPPSCDHTCYSCGTYNGCGEYCGDCPTCDPYCYSCGSYTGCGDYCGDCYYYWCDWNWEGYCCYDNWGSYWCEYYYP